VKETFQTYCATTYARSDVNQRWILKVTAVASLKAQNFSQINSIKTHDFTTFYAFIPHDIIDNCFFKGIGPILFLKNGLKKKLHKKTIKIISEVIIIRYVQL
jgi:hypothetical protein